MPGREGKGKSENSATVRPDQIIKARMHGNALIQVEMLRLIRDENIIRADVKTLPQNREFYWYKEMDVNTWKSLIHAKVKSRFD